MKEADGNIIFKEWLPDLPALDNPGLTDASGVLPADGAYKSFKPLLAATTALSTTCESAYISRSSSGQRLVFAAGVTTIQYLDTGAWVTVGSAFATVAAWSSTGWWNFTQYEDLLVAVNQANGGQALTLSAFTSLGALATTGSLPAFPQFPAVVGQHLVIANSVDTVQWSAIGDPRNWPTPLSATAVATQSGSQIMPSEFGRVTGVVGGDQHGLIFQRDAVTRMTYVGGNTVFQFDTLQQRIGAYFPRSIVQVGGFTYFASTGGFFRTDGVGIEPIGHGKVDTFFRTGGELVTASEQIYSHLMSATVDQTQKLIYWAYPLDAAGQPPPHATHLLIYNYAENRWARATQSVRALFENKSEGEDGFLGPAGISTANAIGYFNGTPTSAVLQTGEVEWSRGGYSRVQGVKPLVDVTANAVTVAIGSRNNRSDAVTYTAETTANGRSGFCDFRSEAKYHRARLTIAGTFNAAQGLEFQVEPSGPV